MSADIYAPSSRNQMPPASDDTRVPLRAFLGCVFVGLFVAVALCWLVVGTASLGVGAIVAGLVFYVIAMGGTGIGLVRHYDKSVLGLCNMTTLLRLVMVSVLVVALFAGTGQSWAVFALAIVALSLDGVDGWLARRQNLTSAFGARFDMEVDAIFALVLALLAYSNGIVGWFVLFLGVPSYLFFVAKRVVPWLDNALPDALSRKAVCVAQLTVLIALQVPLDVVSVIAPFTLIVAAALIWSFGRDILWLARTHR